MRALSRLERGRVRIVAAPSIATLVLPPIIAAFSKDHPGIRLSVADVTSREAERQVLAGQADFGFTSRWSVSTDLTFQPLILDAFGVVFPKGHRFGRRRRSLAWSELQQERCVGLADDTGIRVILREEPGLPEAVTNPSYEASTTTSLDVMVAQGLGIAVLPALAAARPPLSRLGFRVLMRPEALRTLGLITSAHRPLSPAANRCAIRICEGAAAIERRPHIQTAQSAGRT
jgi:DNA-binding transcriptional LysR family regulator